MKWFGLILVTLVALLAYVRLAPFDTARWHRIVGAPEGDGLIVEVGGTWYRRHISAPATEVLTALNGIALDTPRTQQLAGGVDTSMISYVTRSKVFGFPDITTIQVIENDGETTLTIHARLRFGVSDTGVNAARLKVWIDALRRVQPG